mmetsp:Transcript_1851/g.5269  ORF Transcript_1851/g.5269 Transcript_1851/m.5269 type:complete len:277 (-) Transcript_1851:172-1002(-)
MEVIAFEGHPESGPIRQVNKAILGQWFVRKQAAKVGQDLIGIRRERYELCERAVGESVLQVVGIYGRAVGDDRDIVRRRHRDHAPCLRQATQPSDVGLKHIDSAVSDELSEAIARILVLAGRSEHTAAAKRLADLSVTFVIVRWQELLDPLQAEWRKSLGQLDCVWSIESHVAVEHERKLGADGLAPLLEEGHIGAEAIIAVRWSVRAWNLGTCEAHRLRKVGPSGRAVDRAALLGGAAEQSVHGLVPQLPEKIPEGEVDGGDCLKRQTFASIVYR